MTGYAITLTLGKSLLHETKSTDQLLKVEDYKVGFRTDRGLAKAVDGVSFSLNKGKTLAIVGESGSGKTVLNRGIMGLLGSNIIESGSVEGFNELCKRMKDNGFSYEDITDDDVLAQILI